MPFVGANSRIIETGPSKLAESPQIRKTGLTVVSGLIAKVLFESVRITVHLDVSTDAGAENFSTFRDFHRKTTKNIGKERPSVTVPKPKNSLAKVLKPREKNPSSGMRSIPMKARTIRAYTLLEALIVLIILFILVMVIIGLVRYDGDSSADQAVRTAPPTSAQGLPFPLA